MIFVVPYVLHREKELIAAVMVVESDSFTGAEQRVLALAGHVKGARVECGNAVELDERVDGQRVEVARWEAQ